MKTLTGKTIELSAIFASTTIMDLKLKIQEEMGIPPSNNRLIFKPAQLEDPVQLEDLVLLSDYDFPPGGTMHMVLDMKGGKLLYHVSAYSLHFSFVLLRSEP